MLLLEVRTRILFRYLHTDIEDPIKLLNYEGGSESKERLRIQPAQLFHCTRSVMWFVH